jgi:hypothetical protein
MYEPYKGLQSLQNREKPVSTDFNWEGYSRFMADRFTIVNKDKEEVVFKQQPAQLDFLYQMSQYYQILILKARKMGFSSTALGVAATKFLTGRNENCVSMSFDADASVKQLARAKHYIKSYERITGTKIPFKYNRQNAMVFEGKDPETGETWTNTLRVGTAKSSSFGRGDDITFLHLTEVAFCDDIPTLLSGVGEALVRGSHTIFETTANGFNSYKRFWDDSMRNSTGFAALFYTPDWEYDKEYLALREKRLGRLFAQEYPPTAQQAFLTSGQPYFDAEAMQDMLLAVQGRKPINV